MFKTISALAIATASIAAPAVAQDASAPVQAVAAPVAPVVTLDSSGLAGAYIIGGIGVAGAAAIIALAASDDDDSAASTVTSTNGT